MQMIDVLYKHKNMKHYSKKLKKKVKTATFHKVQLKFCKSTMDM